MIDTLNFRLHRSQFDRAQILKIFDAKTEAKSQTTYKDNKSINVGHKNYKFTLGDTYLSAYGSLTKLHYDNNFQQLSFIQIQDTIKYLEELLEMSLNEAEITRIDLACNIEMNNSVNQYLDIFSTPVGYKACIYEGETKYFESGKDKLCFYDKGKELKAKHEQILRGHEQKNILRYEISIQKNIASALKWEDSKLENIHNYFDYLSILKKFFLAYKNLPIHTLPMPAQLNFDKLSDFKNSLIIEGIRSIGGTQSLESALKNKTIKREVRHNIRKFINSLPKGEILSPELKKELDLKLSAICNKEAYQAFEWSD